MKWVKASERMPEDWDSVSAIRKLSGSVISTDFICKVHTGNLNGIELDNSMWRGQMFIEMEDIEWLDETETSIERQLLSITPEERLNIFASFCTHCGDDDPNCKCWNDE